MTRYLNFCTARAVTVVIFGHLNRSFYLLTYLRSSDGRGRLSDSEVSVAYIMSKIPGWGSRSRIPHHSDVLFYFLWGEILRVNPQFLTKFCNRNPHKLRKSYYSSDVRFGLIA